MGIIYVQRDGSGKIIGTYANPQPGVAEDGAYEESAEVQAFLNPPDLSIYRRAGASRRDRQFRRRLDADPIEALIDRAKAETGK